MSGEGAAARDPPPGGGAAAGSCGGASSGSDCDFGALETAFERPFASHSLVYAGHAVDVDQVEFVFELVEPSGEVACSLRPALRLAGVGALLGGRRREGAAMDGAVAQAVLALGMAMLSYAWMGFLTPTIVVRAARLTEEQVAFWRLVLLQSLREHLFVNGVLSLDGRGKLDDLRVISAEFGPFSDVAPEPAPDWACGAGGGGPRVLVPMGAGKDSTVAWELLGRAAGGCERSWFFLEGATREFARCWRYPALAEASGVGASDVLVAEFVWPVGDFERARNQALSLCGHPWACLVCFASALVAIAHGFGYVAVGNERSAGLGNGVEWEGVEVNHQWDKSFEFEREANGYLRRHCAGLVHYFSPLAPLWDLQVAMLFGHCCRSYLPLILSCNDPKGPDATRWCAGCAKCAFVAAVLGAFLPVRDVRAVFGDDLFETAAIAAHLDLLAGLGPEASKDDLDSVAVPLAIPAPARAHCRVLVEPWKPLECVGGAAETRLALCLVERRYWSESRRLPRFFTAARRAALETAEPQEASDEGALLRDWTDEHVIPGWQAPATRAALAEALQALEAEGIIRASHGKPM